MSLSLLGEVHRHQQKLFAHFHLFSRKFVFRCFVTRGSQASAFPFIPPMLLLPAQVPHLIATPPLTHQTPSRPLFHPPSNSQQVTGVDTDAAFGERTCSTPRVSLSSQRYDRSGPRTSQTAPASVAGPLTYWNGMCRRLCRDFPQSSDFWRAFVSVGVTRSRGGRGNSSYYHSKQRGWFSDFQ